jgi:carbonic anhydrase
MKSYEKLLLENKAWASEKLSINKDYFTDLAKNEQPEFLWIGCSDSRVPALEVTNSEPGEMFVHRNVANIVVNTDVNLMSVLQYALEVLQVKHVIVCGHYGCGAIKAAITKDSYGLIDAWLKNIKDVYRIYREELDIIPDLEQKQKRLVELNVKEQVLNLAKGRIIQRAWASTHKHPVLHGWVYDINTGILNDIIKIKPEDYKDELYRFDEMSFKKNIKSNESVE